MRTVRADEVKAGDMVIDIRDAAGLEQLDLPAEVTESYIPFHLPALRRLVIAGKVYQTHAHMPVTIA